MLCAESEIIMIFFVDVIESIHAGGQYWVLVFYGVKSKLLAYYILASK